MNSMEMNRKDPVNHPGHYEQACSINTLDAEKYLLDMTRAFEDFKFKEIKEKHDL